MLVPMHGKIRLSIPQLRRIALQAVMDIYEMAALIEEAKDKPVQFETYIMKGAEYLASLMVTTPKMSADDTWALVLQTSLPRYVAVVRLMAPYWLDPIELVIDTTRTYVNTHCLAIVQRSSVCEESAVCARKLAEKYQVKVCL